MHVSSSRLSLWPIFVGALSLCLSPGATADVQRWQGKDGSAFEGYFQTVDQKTGKYVFEDIHGNIIRIDPDGLNEEGRRLVAEHLKEKADKADRDKRPRMAPPGALAFNKPAGHTREWTNSEGKTVTGTIVEATRDEVKLLIRGRPSTIPLGDLRAEDAAAALLWTGTTNDPCDVSEGTFHYGVTCDGDEILKFSVELSGNFSRVVMEYTEVVTGFTPAGEKRRVVSDIRNSLVTDHSSGAFQTAQWMKGKEWVKTSIGRWHPLAHREAEALLPRRAEWLSRVLPEMEVAPAGPWLARRLVLEDRSDPNRMFNEWIESNPLALIRFADSNLPAALRLVLEAPAVVDTAPPDPSLAAPLPRRVIPFSATLVRYPRMDGILGALQAHGLAPIAWSFSVSEKHAGKYVRPGQYVVALKRFDTAIPEASRFEIDPMAAGMEEDSYKDFRRRR